METRRPPEFVLELSADRSNVTDVVKGILHTIFFHRLFTPLTPTTHETLSLTLPYIDLPEITSLVDTKATAILRHIDALSTSTTNATASPQYHAASSTRPLRTTLTLSFLEKKRRKGWFVAKADEETVWESWVIKIEVPSARSEVEAGRNKRVMEKLLAKAVLQVVETVNRERAHIPPITTNEANPFPYQIVVGGKG